jgi:hypothetical protein
MSRLDGRSLWSEILQANQKQRADLLRRLGNLLKRLHATPVPPLLAAESPWVDRTLVKASENLAWCDGTAEFLADLHRRRLLSPIDRVSRKWFEDLYEFFSTRHSPYSQLAVTR